MAIRTSYKEADERLFPPDRKLFDRWLTRFKWKILLSARSIYFFQDASLQFLTVDGLSALL